MHEPIILPRSRPARLLDARTGWERLHPEAILMLSEVLPSECVDARCGRWRSPYESLDTTALRRIADWMAEPGESALNALLRLLDLPEAEARAMAMMAALDDAMGDDADLGAETFDIAGGAD